MCVCMYELSPLLCCSYRGQLESILNFAYAIADSPSERERALLEGHIFSTDSEAECRERCVQVQYAWMCLYVCVCMCIDAELSMRE